MAGEAAAHEYVCDGHENLLGAMNFLLRCY